MDYNIDRDQMKLCHCCLADSLWL